MNFQTEKLAINGICGNIQALRDVPVLPEGQKPRGLAIVAHPHPLFGGTMQNKVTQTVARAFAQVGFIAVRFNFRGVDESAGEHDEGRGETDDFLHVLDHQYKEICAISQNNDLPIALAGFSFGAFVAVQALQKIHQQNQHTIDKIVLVGAAASRFPLAEIPASLHERSLILHGEMDDTIPLSDLLNWARPQVLPVTIIPSGGHFFHGQLPLLRNIVLRHLRD